jgi:hypothetical protein
MGIHESRGEHLAAGFQKLITRVLLPQILVGSKVSNPLSLDTDPPSVVGRFPGADDQPFRQD